MLRPLNIVMMPAAAHTVKKGVVDDGHTTMTCHNHYVGAPTSLTTPNWQGTGRQQRPHSAMPCHRLTLPRDSTLAAATRSRPMSASARLTRDVAQEEEQQGRTKLPGWPNPGDVYEQTVPSAGPWHVDLLRLGDQTYLLDCASGGVFAEDIQRCGGLPRLLGTWKVSASLGAVSMLLQRLGHGLHAARACSPAARRGWPCLRAPHRSGQGGRGRITLPRRHGAMQLMGEHAAASYHAKPLCAKVAGAGGHMLAC